MSTKSLKTFLSLSFLLSCCLLPSVGEAALTDGLVGYYSLDGKYVNWQTGTVTNQGSGGGTLTLNSLSTSTTPISGAVGQGFFFASTTIPTNVASGTSALTAIDNWTLVAWMNPKVITATTGFVMHNGGDDGLCAPAANCTGYGFGIGDATGQSGSKLVGLLSGIAWIDSGFTFPAANRWYFVVMQRKSGTIRFYVNGVQQSGSSVSTPNTPNGFMTIGGQVPYTTGKRLFNGSVDEVRMYNRAISSDEIMQLYKQGKSKVGVSQKIVSGVGINSLSSGLVGYWTFDGKDTNWRINTTNDLSSTGNTVTLSGFSTSTDVVRGKVGQALHFGGSATTPAALFSSPISVGTTHTLSAWIKVDKSGFIGYQNIVGDSAGGQGLYLTSSGGPYSLTYYFSGLDHTAASSIPVNTWTHVAASISSGRLTLYVNGVADPTSYTGVGANTFSFIGNDLSSEAFQGSIDDVHVYNRALSATEVMQLYKQGGGVIAVSPKVLAGQSGTSLSKGLAGYWTLDGKNTNWTSNTVTDSSGNGLTGTLVNFSTTTSAISGKVGQALRFNSGSSQYINLGSQASLRFSQNVTVSAWVYPTVANMSGKAVFTFDSGACCGTNYYLGSGISGSAGHFGFSINVSGQTAQDPNTYSVNKWYHLVGTYDGSTINFYENGSLITSVGYVSSMSLYNNNIATIGGAQTNGAAGTNLFDGTIDEVRVYSRALSANEVAQLYKQGQAKTR